MSSTSFLLIVGLIVASVHANAAEDALIHPTKHTFIGAYVCAKESEARATFNEIMTIVRSQPSALVESNSPCKFGDTFSADVFLVESWDGTDGGVKINMWKTSTFPPSFIVDSFNVPNN